MHISELRVAILNFLVAQQRNENFTVRINDIDKEKNIEGKDTEIMQILEKFALGHESVFHQSEHLHMHQTLALKLLEQNKAFICTCTPEQLKSDIYSGRCENVHTSEHTKLKESGTPFVIRVKKPTQDINIHNIIGANITTSPREIDSFVILNVDSIPTHNFASACDDMLSGVNMIIDEEATFKNTAKQIYIKKLLGYEQETDYAHLPMVLNAPSVKYLFEHGYIPDAIINYLILLGYSKTPKEIFTLPEVIEWFELENISKLPVKFDIDTLRFINREHLRRIDDKVLSSFFGFADADVGKLIKLYLEEASTINELALKIRPIFAPKIFEGEWKEQMGVMQKIIADAPMINDFNDFKIYVMEHSRLKDKDFFTPLRLLLTGAQNGPELSDIYPLIKSYLLEIAS